MYIYIDESGSFVETSKEDAWNTIAALATPNESNDAIPNIVGELKRRNGSPDDEELKLRDIKNEHDYFNFLIDISKAKCMAICAATNSSHNTSERVIAHKLHHVNDLRKNSERMLHNAMKEYLLKLSSDVDSLSNQLYVQLFIQFQVMYDVVNLATNYYAQYSPESLGNFTWIIDAKNQHKVTSYEGAFEALTAPMLQSMSLRNPMFMVEGFDYSHMAKYEYDPGETPNYLEEQYGITFEREGPNHNLGRIIREDISFMDSKLSPGIQASDLIASGVRRCLKNEFNENQRAAALLGQCMVQTAIGQPPISLLSLGEESELSTYSSYLVKKMKTNSRPFLKTEK